MERGQKEGRKHAPVQRNVLSWRRNVISKNISAQSEILLPIHVTPRESYQRHHTTKHTLLLRKCGYAQTMSRDIVFGNKSIGGLGWCDMEVE
jgi:hypothetical protein